ARGGGAAHQAQRLGGRSGRPAHPHLVPRRGRSRSGSLTSALPRRDPTSSAGSPEPSACPGPHPWGLPCKRAAPHIVERERPLARAAGRGSVRDPRSKCMKEAYEVDGLVARISALQDHQSYQEQHWEGSFEDYLRIVQKNPKVTRTAFQRLYDMILSYGKTEYIDNKKKLIRYHFFLDETNGGKDAIYGLDIPLMKLVNVFKAAAEGYGTEKRVILLLGPVGSSKSTIARLRKKGMEAYSKTPEGALYTFYWVLDKKRPDGTVEQEIMHCPMHEEPLHLIPEEWREKAYSELVPPGSGFRIPDTGELCPACRFVFRKRMTKYKGDCAKVVSHVRVRRLILSEKARVGIGTFQPKDEKNQDSTELTGDINYRKIAEYGSDSDPRAFNFDGEFNVANRGVIEFVEVLKLDVAFLYDLLGATQEHKVKPKKFAQTDIDEVILGHTNEAEYKKLLNNEFMEALRDRTIKIDVPYITKVSEEIKIYQKEFGEGRLRGKHVAPHT